MGRGVALMAALTHRRVILMAVLPALAAAEPAAAQGRLAELTSTPESAAEIFLRSVRAIRWGAAAQVMHPDALERFRELVQAMANLDATGETRVFLTHEDSVGLAALDATEVFDRAIGTMVDSLPGFMNALFDHDDHVMGHVSESPDTAHVVYRTTPRISGAVSEVQVMQLVRTAEGWRVRWSDELESLDSALRGVMLGRKRREGENLAGGDSGHRRAGRRVSVAAPVGAPVAFRPVSGTVPRPEGAAPSP